MRRGGELGCGCSASPTGLAGVMDSFGVPALLFVGLFGGAALVTWTVLKSKMKGA